jgi:hypothetical protein
MDFSKNLSSIFPTSQALILEELIQTPKPVSGRQLALQLVDRLGKSRVLEVLGELVAQGLVTREILGPSHLYSINKQHLCFDLLKSLSSPKTLLVSLITKQLARFKPQPQAAVLFGSIAKGKSKPESDIDLLVIRPNRVREDDDAWQDQLFRLTLAVQRATGNPLNYLDYSHADFASLVRSGARLIREINQHGIVLMGKFDYQAAKAG